MTTTAHGAPRVSLVTLGCGRNEVDSDQLAGLLVRDGLRVVDDGDDADVLVVNTCTFIGPAKQESIDTILAACDRKDDGVRAVVVVGCMAERYPDELADAIPEADAVVGFDAYPALPALIGDVLEGRPHARVLRSTSGPGEQLARRTAGRALPIARVGVGRGRGDTPAASDVDSDDGDSMAGHAATVQWRPGPTAQDDLDRVPASGPRFPVRRLLTPDGAPRPWAYLKIASGCDRACTFCAIPSFRGTFRSRPPDELVAEARWLADQGVRELVLVSENTTSWGKDLPGGRALQPELLARLADVEGIERLRLMYLQPDELRPALLEAIAAIDQVCAYLDLSLQHVAASLLRRMARSGSPERFGALLDHARSLMPDVVIRSNFILGFPGETEADVDALEAFLERHRLDWVGLFPFSVEDGTPSASMPQQVPEAVARDRVARIAAIQDRIADDLGAARVGTRLQVLVDEVTADGAVGRSYREAPDTDGEIRLHRDASDRAAIGVGDLVDVEITASDGVDLVGTVLVPVGGAARG